MNFLPARLDSGRILMAYDATLETAPLVPHPSPPRGRAVTLGVRPKHSDVVVQVEGLPAEIGLVEPLGLDTLVRVSLAGQAAIVRTDPDLRPKARDMLHVLPVPGNAHLLSKDGLSLSIPAAKR